MDVLRDHLARARAGGAVFARTVAEPPWGLRLVGTIQLSVHVVVRGRGWIWFDDQRSPVELVPGEVTLVRGGSRHYIGHEPGADCLEPDEISGLSRSAFARNFQDVLGQTPMQYLTEWRMALARDHLRAGELGMTAIARNVGYGSPYAFAAAFRRHHGEPPGAWRQRESALDQAFVAGGLHPH